MDTDHKGRIGFISRADLRPKRLILNGEFIDLGFEFIDFGHGFIVKALENLVLVTKRREILGGLGRLGKGFRGFGDGFLNVVTVMALSFDFLKEVLFASLEKIMGINVVDILSSFLVEIVHVELSDKGSEIVVLEVSREDLLAEFRRLFDNESCAFRIPVNDVGELSFFKNVVSFANERWD